MQQESIKPHLKLIESICLKRFNYSEDGHECYVHVLGKLMENNYARVNAFQGRSTFKTYLVSITNRLAIDFYRHRYGKTSKKAADEQPVPKKNPLKIVPIKDQESLSDKKLLEDDVIDNEVKETKNRLEALVKTHLSDLSPEDRLLLKMKYEDDFKVSEIAGILKLDQKKTYRRINSILAAFRDKIMDEGIDFTGVIDIVKLILLFLVF